jgi:hypothetical protein
MRSHLEDLSQLRFELNPACHCSSRFIAWPSESSGLAVRCSTLGIPPQPSVLSPSELGSGQASGLYPNPLSDAYPLSFSPITVLIRGKNGTGFDTA